MEVTNWGSLIKTRPSKVKEVFKVQDIIDVVKDPVQFPSPVRALGSRHSPTKCIDADSGTVLDMRHLSYINEPDETEMTLTVGGGTIYYDIVHFLEARGFMLRVNTEIGMLTAGAAVMGQTKDSAFPGEYGQVSSEVVAVKLVTAQGEILEVSEKNDPEFMKFVRCSYGMLGVAFEVTFRIVPLRLMRVYHKHFTVPEFIEQLADIRAARAALMYYMMPMRGLVVVEYRTYAPDESEEDGIQREPGVVHNKHLLPLGDSSILAVRNFIWAKLNPVTSRLLLSVPRLLSVPGFWLANNLLFSGFNFTASHRHLPAAQVITYPEDPPASTVFTFSIMSFTADKFKEAMTAYYKFVLDYHDRTGWNVSMMDVGYRLFHDDKSYLSYTDGGESWTIDPVTNPNSGWYPFLKEFNKLGASFGGKPLLNQTPLLTADHFHAAFGPQIRQFNVHRKRMDPDNRFLSTFFKDLYQCS
ncbi:uncharacterized protein LOC135805400 [Sycon ciliatum]|uniref:uncharacterized protein LOC135805400 n=1 Tax=Sycon ciliatum TaxID=27933 RepID=UPI0020AC1B6C|eukprot:scpid65750/ scgid14047/ D-arabinono-1,4-lactone oxidase; L-galactono-gamma-lactone oxidase